MTDILKLSREEVIQRLRVLIEQDMHTVEESSLPHDLREAVNQRMQLNMRVVELLSAQVG